MIATELESKLNKFKSGEYDSVLTEGMEVFNQVVKFKAKVDYVSRIVKEYKKDILENKMVMLSSDDGNRILDPNLTYLATTEDFKRYLDLVEEAKIEHGFESYPKDICPKLTLEQDLRNLERKLIDLFSPINGFSYQDIVSSRDCVENIQKIVDLIGQLLLNREGVNK